jgi:cysteine desulfurase
VTIYLDYNATTPVVGEVLDVIVTLLRDGFGNPSSQHAYGVAAREAVVRAREEVAASIGASAAGIVFTSGGTEATNAALKGLAHVALRNAAAMQRRRIVVSAIEHPATVETARALQRIGFEVALVGVDAHGTLDLDALERALAVPTLVASLMHANNETGTLQPIAEASRRVHAAGGLVHVDASQSLGKVDVDVDRLGADLLTIAGHKVYAPKGVGALYVRPGVELEPFVHGAGQEGGRRAGTENVPYIAGLGVACRLAREFVAAGAPRMAALRDHLWDALARGLGERVTMNGHPEHRLPNTLNASFVGLVGAELLAAVPEVAASTGSACHDGRVSISPVLAAMGVDPCVAAGAVRFSLGRPTTAEDIDAAAAAIVARARAMLRERGA